MRELKFRAWDKDKKVMHYDFQFIKSGESIGDFIMFISDKKNDLAKLQNPYFVNRFEIMQYIGSNDKELCFVNRFEIMQYIGFNDENDKEIYEGDILQNKFDDIKVVEFEDCVIENCGCCNMVRAIGYDFTDFFNDIQSTKIIGNKYENPELCEEAK